MRQNPRGPRRDRGGFEGLFIDFYDKSTAQQSPMLVDPLTPRVEVLGSALVRDRLQRPGRNFVFGRHGNSHDPDFVRFWLLVAHLQVAADASGTLVAEIVEYRRNLAWKSSSGPFTA